MVLAVLALRPVPASAQAVTAITWAAKLAIKMLALRGFMAAAGDIAGTASDPGMQEHFCDVVMGRAGANSGVDEAINEVRYIEQHADCAAGPKTKGRSFTVEEVKALNDQATSLLSQYEPKKFARIACANDVNTYRGKIAKLQMELVLFGHIASQPPNPNAAKSPLCKLPGDNKKDDSDDDDDDKKAAPKKKKK